MNNAQTESPTDHEFQPYAGKYNETFSPVVLTDSIGAIFLGIISLLLVLVVGGLLARNRELENRLRGLDRSVN